MWTTLDNWIKIESSIHGDFFVPPDYRTSGKYPFQIRLYPKENMIMIEEKDKYYDHAIVKFNVSRIEHANFIVNHLVSLRTV
jgi:hypothetical protein